MATLLGQPPEVLHGILLHVNPWDLATLSQTCSHLKGYILNDNLLWKLHYLKRFDCPAIYGDQNTADGSWQDQVKEVVAVQRLLESSDEDLKKADVSMERICSMVFDLLTSSTSQPLKNTSFLSNYFISDSNISSFLCRSSLFKSARYPADSPSSSFLHRQLSAKLFCYYGLEIEPSASDTLSNKALAVHPYARSRVYDLRRYNQQNLWGPFLDDGSGGTDWEKVQCILIDLLYNLRTYTDRRSPSSSSSSSSASSSSSSPSSQLWDHPFAGLAPHSYNSLALSGTLASDPDPGLTSQDPYGVTGTWMRIVCFLDYNDLYAFNFERVPIPLSEDREPIDTREAFRLIRLQLRVTHIEFDEDAGGEAVGKPVVHFEGRSKSTYMAWDPNANSRIRGECWKTVGSVRTTPTGDIRWTTFSIFHGEERWRSEGVQIGGIQSARGILGNWFDKDYDVHGPAGPTCFWKVSDDIQEEKKRLDLNGNLWTPPWHEVVNVLFE